MENRSQISPESRSQQPDTQTEPRQGSGHMLDLHHQEWVRRAGQVAGFLYLAGDIAFMSHAKTMKDGGIDKLRMARGLTYLVGSLILLCYADGKDKSPYAQAQHDKLQRSIDGEMKAAGISDETKETLTQWVRRELKEHPWELSYLLFIAGSSMQGVSALSQKRYTEAAATLATIASILVPVVVPEGDQKPFIKLSKNMEQQGHHFAQSYHHIKQAMPILKPAFDISDMMLHQVFEHPLRVGSGLAIVANSMYGVQALKRQPVEKGLAIMSGLYLSANIVTTFASKNMKSAERPPPEPGDDSAWHAHADRLNQQMDAAQSTPHRPVQCL